MKNLSPFVVLLIAFSFGCGDNLQSPIPVTSFAPPTNLRALSTNQSGIEVRWIAALNAADSSFSGYIAQAGNRVDTLSKTSLTFVADSLPLGVSTFSVYSLRSDGLRSDAATIRWAPSARFDSVYNVFENATPVSSRPEGFNIGTATTDPSVMAINLNDPVVQQTMDLFFNGDSVETRQSLSMWSANLRLATLSRTLFSTRTDASPSLDFPLNAFPAENTFVKDSITVIDNTIYYVKVIGDPLQVNYARLHIRIKPGTAVPNRIIEIRVSLQRVPGLLYAFDPRDVTRDFILNTKLYSFITHNHS